MVVWCEIFRKKETSNGAVVIKEVDLTELKSKVFS